jgi:RimJ/RimL family protein N-acetyltransferase
MTRETSGSIQTAHLELVPLTDRFVRAVVAGDANAAALDVGARVGRWLTTDPSHMVQLHLAGQRAEAAGFPGLGRCVIRQSPRLARRVIGSIGFHGSPDDRGRLEASCRIHPAHQGRGYAAEALAGLLDWATGRYGITRFLVAVPARYESVQPVPVEIGSGRTQPIEQQVDQIAGLLEPNRPVVRHHR